MSEFEYDPEVEEVDVEPFEGDPDEDAGYGVDRSDDFDDALEDEDV